jgi:putative phosphoribosyl transferase
VSSDDSGRGAMVRPVRIPTDGPSLAGDLAVPSGAAGVVLFAHGSGSSRLSPRNRFVARTIQQSGAATLLFDLLSPQEERDDAMDGIPDLC